MTIRVTLDKGNGATDTRNDGDRSSSVDMAHGVFSYERHDHQIKRNYHLRSGVMAQ